MTCLCLKGRWNPECPKHGRSWRLLSIPAYLIALTLAVVVTEATA